MTPPTDPPERLRPRAFRLDGDGSTVEPASAPRGGEPQVVITVQDDPYAREAEALALPREEAAIESAQRLRICDGLEGCDALRWRKRPSIA